MGLMGLFKLQRQCQHLGAWPAGGGGWCPECNLNLEAAETAVVVIGCTYHLRHPDEPSELTACSDVITYGTLITSDAADLLGLDRCDRCFGDVEV